jgi:hypothetical protein
VIQQAMDKIIKSAEITMQSALLVQQELHQLPEGNKYQKAKQAVPRSFI